MTGPRRLDAAVLHRAVLDLCAKIPHKPVPGATYRQRTKYREQMKEYREKTDSAVQFFFGRGNPDHYFSLENLCGRLNGDVAVVLRAIEKRITPEKKEEIAGILAGCGR